MTFISLLASIFGIVSAFALVPQVIKIYKRKSANDISLATYAIMSIGSIVWVAYGLEIKSVPLVLSNGLGGINCALILIGRLKYGDLPDSLLRFVPQEVSDVEKS
jgi:MtN3 and saliva related transmembrane protein